MRTRAIKNGNVVWFGVSNVQNAKEQIFTSNMKEQSTYEYKLDNTLPGQPVDFKCETSALLFIETEVFLYNKNNKLIYRTSFNGTDTKRTVLTDVATKLVITSGTSKLTRVITSTFSKFQIVEKYNDDNTSFASEQQGVADCLTQQLSVLKNELWYRVTYGLPLLEKVKNKAIIDASVMDIITTHPDVVSILSFESEIKDKKYTCKVEILSNYGNITILI